jgi:hypothetical protein
VGAGPLGRRYADYARLLIGYGAEHDRALAAYKAIETANAHVKTLTFAGETNPQVIADALLRMIA